MSSITYCCHADLLEGVTGKGLGHEFLRHCQRARILLHVIDGSSPDPIEDFKAIQMELELFAEDLAVKPQVCHKRLHAVHALHAEMHLKSTLAVQI